MQLRHFTAAAPVCPVCAHAGRPAAPLVVAHVSAGSDTEIDQGILHCPACRHEFPVLCGVPVIVPQVATLLAERGLELMLRDDVAPMLESLLGDAIGPDSWFDVTRQVQSTYAWDGYADLDPAEPPPADDSPRPGAARRCLRRLLDLAPPQTPPQLVLDLGCAAGRTGFDLADAFPSALVLGLDVHLGLLRLAQRARAGHISYPRRRIGLAYDRRRFDVTLPHADRVDFWAADAASLPFAAASAGLCVALNLLDCVPDPRALLESLAHVTRPGGRILLATPYDWSTRATPMAAWLGGHSQRAPHGGAGEAFLHALIAGEAGHAIPGLALCGEEAAWPWQTRLHERSAVSYRTHLVGLERK